MITHIDNLTALAISIFLVVGILIPIHEKYKYLAWMDFENRDVYNAKAKKIYNLLITMCVTASAIITFYPLSIRLDNQIFYNKEFAKSIIVFFANFFAVMAHIFIGAFIGSNVAKLFNTKK